MDNAVRVAVVDDDDLFVRGLGLVLAEVSGGRARVVATSGDATYAPSVVRHAMPDVVLVDVRLLRPGGIPAIRRSVPQARVLAMAGDGDPAVAVAALRAGAAGFLSKSSEPADLMPPLLAALQGWAVLPAVLLPALTAGPVPSPADRLGDRDRHLLRLIANGASTVRIAAELHVSERTVKRSTAALLRRLRVSSRTQAAALAGSAGFLDRKLCEAGDE